MYFKLILSINWRPLHFKGNGEDPDPQGYIQFALNIVFKFGNFDFDKSLGIVQCKIVHV